MLRMLKNKKGRFVDAFRAITVGNVFFFIVILLVGTFALSFLGKQIFGTKIVAVGPAFRLLIIGGALTISFYVVIKKQGNLDRGDVFVIIFLGVALGALWYYLPTLAPEIFSSLKQSALASPESPFTILYNASVTLHNSIQSIIPIP